MTVEIRVVSAFAAGRGDDATALVLASGQGGGRFKFGHLHQSLSGQHLLVFLSAVPAAPKRRGEMVCTASTVNGILRAARRSSQICSTRRQS